MNINAEYFANLLEIMGLRLFDGTGNYGCEVSRFHHRQLDRLLTQAEGDTTEIESLQDENDFSSPQGGTNQVGSIPQYAAEDWIQGHGLGEDLNTREPEITDSRTMIAFQCIAELDTRVKSIQGSLSTLTDKIETLCSDLEDIVHRLVAVETAIETMASDGQDTTEERKTTERTRRRQ
ncbi:hypothetical protein N7490_001855 [Penicillium lividum]|nr:hypothetical protein N7490_001855 [Penicillium lividum]